MLGLLYIYPIYRRVLLSCHGGNDLTIPRIMANAGASHISMELGLTGPGFTLSTACASAAHAIGHAYWMVRSAERPSPSPAAARPRSASAC